MAVCIPSSSVPPRRDSPRPVSVVSIIRSTLRPKYPSVVGAHCACCPVHHTDAVMPADARICRMTGASLIASGRVPTSSATRRRGARRLGLGDLSARQLRTTIAPISFCHNHRPLVWPVKLGSPPAFPLWARSQRRDPARARRVSDCSAHQAHDTRYRPKRLRARYAPRAGLAAPSASNSSSARGR